MATENKDVPDKFWSFGHVSVIGCHWLSLTSLPHARMHGGTDGLHVARCLLQVTLATYATWVLTGHPLDADTAFVSLSLFNILRFPINLLPMMVSYLVTVST